MDRVNLLDLDVAALTALVSSLDEKPFRARQLARWIHRRGARSFDQMTDLARSLRAKLDERAQIGAAAVLRDASAADGTRKWLLDVGAGNAIETVYIPEDDRGTLCISTQAGCAMACLFCATGAQGFNRNLTTAEIVGQLWWAEHALRADAGLRGCEEIVGSRPEIAPSEPHPYTDVRRAAQARDRGAQQIYSQPLRGEHERVISNVVLMGMGEPLQNLEAVLPALRLMLDDDAYGLSRRRVTLSTSGLVRQMDKLAQQCPVALAVSLHAPNDELRDRLVPLNRKHPLRDLMAACRRYLEHAPRDFITFEYVMIDGVNDRDEQARELLALVRDVPCKFNLIPFNPFPGSALARSPAARIAAFARILQDAGIVTTTRRTRGDDIDAACGQLAGEVRDRTRRSERRAKLPPLAVSIEAV